MWRVEQNLQSAHAHSYTHTHTQTGHGCRMAIVTAFGAYCPGCCDALSRRWVIWLRTVAGYLSQEVDGQLMCRTVFVCWWVTDWSLLLLIGGWRRRGAAVAGFLAISCKLQVPFQLEKMSHQKTMKEAPLGTNRDETQRMYSWRMDRLHTVHTKKEMDFPKNSRHTAL